MSLGTSAQSTEQPLPITGSLRESYIKILASSCRSNMLTCQLTTRASIRQSTCKVLSSDPIVQRQQRFSSKNPNLQAKSRFSKSPNLAPLTNPTKSSRPSASSSTISSETAKISQRSEQIARHFSSSTMASKYSVRKIGAPNTLEHRIYIEKDGVPVSSFHDIPLYANAEQTILNMVVEIPRWTNAKLEVC